MSIPADDSLWALTEKEKQTLRLIVRGHDAKSTARSLGLSVHTINERLRDARRKMAVSSSREAARLLLQAEDPELFGDTQIGADALRPVDDQEDAPTDGAGRARRPSRIIIGVFLMTLALALVALAAQPGTLSAPTTPATAEAPDPAVIDTARQFLILGDQGKLEETYQATTASFRKINSFEAWTAAAEKVRAPLGAMLSRSLVSERYLPAPPLGYEVVTFRTRFANKPDTTETVTLERRTAPGALPA